MRPARGIAAIGVLRLLALTFAAVLPACGGDWDRLARVRFPTLSAAAGEWTWISGSQFTSQKGSYGTKGVADPANTPGARAVTSSWLDAAGNFWIFGGEGLDSAGSYATLNDLWKFDGVAWTWVSGSDHAVQPGVYGTKGVADPANVPPSRGAACSWVDSAGRFWIFGGTAPFNDLWRYDGANWTWMSGANTIWQRGTYGTKGFSDPANVPGARYGAASWIDSADRLWLFGGKGADSTGSDGYLNDLWFFDGSAWTWVGGSTFGNQSGTYGTLGVAASSNVPGARTLASSWTDLSGNLWLFGGTWQNTSGNPEAFGDLWKFDGANWIWVAGSELPNQVDSFGTQGVPDPSNRPGARFGSACFRDAAGAFWLFGGNGVASTGGGYMSDLWMFDGATWTWMSGSNLAGEAGVYGTQGVPSSTNRPAGRSLTTGWAHPSGDLWIFGGGVPPINDLWRYRP